MRAQPKKGGLRCGHNQKRGCLRHVYNPKRVELRTGFVTDSVLGTEVAWELIYLLSLLLLVNMINWTGVFWQAEGGGGS